MALAHELSHGFDAHGQKKSILILNARRITVKLDQFAKQTSYKFVNSQVSNACTSLYKSKTIIFSERSSF